MVEELLRHDGRGQALVDAVRGRADDGEEHEHGQCREHERALSLHGLGEGAE